MKNNFFTDWKLLLIFLLSSIGILLKSYFHPDGYLSPDSTKYLELAQRLIDKNSYYVLDLLETEQTLFAHWPVGYPTMIFLIAKISGLSVFWSSKFLNIGILLLTFFLLKKLFNKHAYIYALILFASTFIETFTYTWSEVPFLFGCLWLTTSLYSFTFSTNKNIWLVNITFSALFLLLSRYIGLFSVGVIGLVTLYFLYKKDFKNAIKLLVSLSIVSISSLAYLFMNYVQTGYATGIARTPSDESALDLLKMLVKAVLTEVNVLFLSIQSVNNSFFILTTILLLIFFVASLFTSLLNVKNSITDSARENKSLWIFFLVTGTVYFLSIVYLRWTSTFDDFNYRLLGPATMLFLLMLVSLAQTYMKEKQFKLFKVILATILMLSYIWNTPLDIYKEWKKGGLTYNENIEIVEEKYSFLPDHSIIAFASPHLLYLNSESRQIYIYGTMGDFLSRIKEAKADHVYIEINPSINRNRFDESVINFMEQHKDEQFVKLK